MDAEEDMMAEREIVGDSGGGWRRLIGIGAIVLVTLAVVSLPTGVAGATSGRPRVIELAMLPGANQSVAESINDAGLVVGYTSWTSGIRATLWTQGRGAPGPVSDARRNAGNGYRAIDLGALPGGSQSEASGVNAEGVAAGQSWIDDSSGPLQHAVVWRPDGRHGYTIVDLGTLPGMDNSAARGISDSGMVVGYSGPADAAAPHATAWMPNGSGYRPIDLGILLNPDPSASTAAVATTPSGVVLGGGVTSSGQAVSALWTPDRRGSFTVTILADIAASAISRSGLLAGSQSGHAALWAPDRSGSYTRTELGVLPGHAVSYANGVNSAGLVVGYSWGPDFLDIISTRATAWVPSSGGQYVTTDLGALPGGTASQARAVNRSGMAVGVSDTADATRMAHATIWLDAGRP